MCDHHISSYLLKIRCTRLETSLDQMVYFLSNCQSFDKANRLETANDTVVPVSIVTMVPTTTKRTSRTYLYTRIFLFLYVIFLCVVYIVYRATLHFVCIVMTWRWDRASNIEQLWFRTFIQNIDRFQVNCCWIFVGSRSNASSKAGEGGGCLWI